MATALKRTVGRSPMLRPSLSSSPFLPLPLASQSSAHTSTFFHTFNTAKSKPLPLFQSQRFFASERGRNQRRKPRRDDEFYHTANARGATFWEDGVRPVLPAPKITRRPRRFVRKDLEDEEDEEDADKEEHVTDDRPFRRVKAHAQVVNLTTHRKKKQLSTIPRY